MTPSRREYDPDRPGVQVDPTLRLELRRLANLFLVSSLTLALFVLRAVYLALNASFLPHSALVAWGTVMLVGWAMSLVYGVYVTLKARRWGWLVLCLIPVTCVAAAVAYAWVRRMEVERQVLGDEPRRPPRARGARR